MPELQPLARRWKTSPGLPSPTVLPFTRALAEKDPESFARDVLQAKGYKTLEAVTGEEGVKLAKEKK